MTKVDWNREAIDRLIEQLEVSRNRHVETSDLFLLATKVMQVGKYRRFEWLTGWVVFISLSSVFVAAGLWALRLSLLALGVIE